MFICVCLCLSLCSCGNCSWKEEEECARVREKEIRDRTKGGGGMERGGTGTRRSRKQDKVVCLVSKSLRFTATENGQGSVPCSIPVPRFAHFVSLFNPLTPLSPSLPFSLSLLRLSLHFPYSEQRKWHWWNGGPGNISQILQKFCTRLYGNAHRGVVRHRHRFCQEGRARKKLNVITYYKYASLRYTKSKKPKPGVV